MAAVAAAAAVVCGTGLLYWHIRRNHGMLSGARPLAIWLLESAMLALILFCCGTRAERGHAAPQQNVVAVLVDDSAAWASPMRRHARGGRQARAR